MNDYQTFFQMETEEKKMELGFSIIVTMLLAFFMMRL